MIQTTVTSVTYQGDGSTTSFPFTFDILSNSDIRLQITDPSGNNTVLTTGFVVQGTNVIYPECYATGSTTSLPLQTGYSLMIYRETAKTQERDLGDTWPFNVIEAGLDKLTMIVQEFALTINNALTAASEFVTKAQTYANNAATSATESATSATASAASASDAAKSLSTMESEIDSAVSSATSAAAASATQAANSAVNAAEQVTLAASQVTLAQGQVALATTQANKAEQEADNAAASAEAVAGYMANVSVYSDSVTYNPPDCVMTPDGTCYRCIKTTTGNNPTSTTGYWVTTATVTYQTFGLDTNGDLMPVETPQASASWDIDENGDIEPING